MLLTSKFLLFRLGFSCLKYILYISYNFIEYRIKLGLNEKVPDRSKKQKLNMCLQKENEYRKF